MGNIPIDIAADILSRSPAKSLARFATVSKAWSSLLSDSQFVKLHCNQHLQNLKLIARHGRLYSLDLDSLDCAFRIDYLLKDSDFTVYKVLGLSDHLLCLSVSSKSNQNPDPKSTHTLHFNNVIIVICNLSTGACHIVPPSPVEFPPTTDPYQSNPYEQKRFSYGFGFDPSGEDYKLVRICQKIYGITNIISESKVYSMKTKSWTVINDQDLSRSLVSSREPVALDGVLYWVAGNTSSYNRYNVIMAFDLALGSFRRVRLPLPLPMQHYDRKCWLFSVGGKLCLMCDAFLRHLQGFKFYKMEEDGDSVSWTPFSFVGCAKFFYYKAVSFSENGDRVLVERCEGRFVCLDLAEGTKGRCRVKFFEGRKY